MTLSRGEPALSLHARTLGIVFSLFASPLAASLSAQQDGPTVGARVQLRIDTDRTSYRLGDSIMVRLILRNISDRPIHFQHGTYTGLVDLKVLDEAGCSVQPTIPRLIARFGGPLRTLPVDASLTLLHWKGPSREWLNLRDWGYDLPAPGRYKIVGTSSVGGAQSDAIRMSNQATFLIEK
jgi:hypothetical protein